MGLIQKGSGDVRPLVVQYFAAGSGLDRLDPRTCVWGVGSTAPGFFAAFSAGNPELPSLVEQAKKASGASSFDSVVLLGFSAGNQGVRLQLLHGHYPSATLCVDGVHSSTAETEANAWQIEVWRHWYDLCGAQLGLQPSRTAGVEYRNAPIAWVTASNIQPPTYTSVIETQRRITTWVQMEPGESPSAPNVYSSGNLAIWTYPGGAAKDHIYQAQVVLVERLGELATILGFGAGGPQKAKAKPSLAKKKGGGADWLEPLFWWYGPMMAGTAASLMAATMFYSWVATRPRGARRRRMAMFGVLGGGK
ncbi:MAG: hypothetical protein Q8Q14_05290 [Gemmatimonadales bacterium]|nr:hypothetical protein [Gemmatimonadales bacterium]